MKKLSALLLSGLAVFGLAACGATSGNAEMQTVRLGVTTTQLDHWNHVRDTLAEDGINLEIVEFTDWVTPNTALVEGEIDINSFQTHNFLAAFNAANDQDLTPIADTVLWYFGIYSESLTSLNDIPVGATVSLPDDVTNQGRALLILESAGLIEIDDAAGFEPLPSDITSNPLELEFVPMQAQMLPRSMQDVDITLMNASIAGDAGIDVHAEALFLEPLNPDSPFINVIAARAEDVNRPELLKVVEHFQTDEVADIITEMTNNGSFAVWNQ